MINDVIKYYYRHLVQWILYWCIINKGGLILITNYTCGNRLLDIQSEKWIVTLHYYNEKFRDNVDTYVFYLDKDDSNINFQM